MRINFTPNYTLTPQVFFTGKYPIKKIKELINAGTPIPEISKETGIKTRTLYNIIRENNLRTPTEIKKGSVEKSIAKMHEKNSTKKDMCRKNGVSIEFVNRWFREHNLQIKIKSQKENLEKLVRTRLSDIEIANATGLSITQVRVFRKSHGVNANEERKRLLNQEIIENLRMGLNKKEIAEKLKVSLATIQRHIHDMKSLD